MERPCGELNKEEVIKPNIYEKKLRERFNALCYYLKTKNNIPGVKICEFIQKAGTDCEQKYIQEAILAHKEKKIGGSTEKSPFLGSLKINNNVNRVDLSKSFEDSASKQMGRIWK